MDIWWNNLSLFEQIFFVIALPSTLITLIQTMMLIFGGGFDTAGIDADVSGISGAADVSEFGNGDLSLGETEIEVSSDTAGLRILTVRGVMSFLAIFGWSGFVLTGFGFPLILAAAISFLLGLGAMLGIAYMIMALLRLQESGNADYSMAIGKIGRVYLTIPASGGGQGKIHLLLGESLRELWAITEDTEPLETGTSVRIKSLADGVFTVERE